MKESSNNLGSEEAQPSIAVPLEQRGSELGGGMAAIARDASERPASTPPYWEAGGGSDMRIVAPSPSDRRAKQIQRVRAVIASTALDLLALIAAAVAVDPLLHGEWEFDPGEVRMVAIMPTYLAIAILTGAFSVKALCNHGLSAVRAARAIIWSLMLAMFIFVVANPGGVAAHIEGLIFAILAPVMIIASRIVGAKIVDRITSGDPYIAVVIEDGVSSGLPRTSLVFNARRNRLVPDTVDPGSIRRLAELLRNVDRVTVYAPPGRRADWAHTLRAFDVRVDIRAPELDELVPVGVRRGKEGWHLVVAQPKLSTAQAAVKRTFDLTISCSALIILGLPMICVALLIRGDTPGPALFRQPRVGWGNRVFNIYKFRTMRADSNDHDGAVSTSRNDSRITRLGAFLRRTSIDELPQILNVIKGDMSLVGPRPHAIGSRAEGHLFWEIDDNYWLRHAIKPGITGLAQVKGFRGATEVRGDLTGRVRNDIAYARNWSLLGDIRILLQTLGVLVHPNAY